MHWMQWASITIHITIKDVEKAEILIAFFTSVFNSQASYPQGTQPPELVDRDGEQNKCHS